MFVPRTEDERDECPQDRIACAPSFAISDTTSARGTDDNDTAALNPDLVETGVRRYIGIAMVAALALLALLLWVYFARYRKSASARDFWCCTGKRKPSKPRPPLEEDEASTASSSTETLSGGKEGRRGERVSRQGVVSEKERQPEARGVVKEVSGGVVMFTQAPNAARHNSGDRHHYSPRSHHPPPPGMITTVSPQTTTRTSRTGTRSPPPLVAAPEWQLERFRGVRFESSRPGMKESQPRR